ncbi:MAG: biotin-dependent carboxyltransferase family protein [Burkholderiaceae bacterium]|nr:biotin-dependent carboxyltransferase family protein [Burkholderiaceae bacterium]
MGKALAKIRILKTGLLTTIQDQGRIGLLHMALSRSGAMDLAQMRLANRLVGNDAGAAGLEFTGLGPTIYFDQESCIALTGGLMQATLTVGEGRGENGQSHRLPSHRPVIIPARSTVRFGACTSGFRCWLAIAGGLDCPALLGSRSQHLAAEIGPSRIVAGAELPIGPERLQAIHRIKEALDADPQATEFLIGTGRSLAKLRSTRWSLPAALPLSWPLIELWALPGRHFEMLQPKDRQALLGQTWKVSARSNRQGLGLEGEAISTQQSGNLHSEPVREGTVQLPPAGRPFILLAEHQSTGGYPRVLEVIGAMSSELAQAGPSARIVFKLIDLAAADRLRDVRSREHEAMMASIRSKLP